MNFLAHLYLSEDNEEVLVGNFIGDFVKGVQLNKYPEQVQKGIRLHRSIDYYTDTHDIVLQSKVRLRGRFRHYAPVIVDIFYDHFLARDWSRFSNVPLMKYTLSFYQLMDKYLEIVPKGMARMFSYMSRDNWLYNYRYIEGIDRALTGMSRRTKFESKMEHASEALQKDYRRFEDEFNRFFPELQAHVGNFET